MSETLEAKARKLLARAGVPDVDTYTAGDLVEIANLLAPPVGTLEVTRDRPVVVSDHVLYGIPVASIASTLPPGTYTIHRSEP